MRLTIDWIEEPGEAAGWSGAGVIALARAPSAHERSAAGRRATLANLAEVALGRDGVSIAADAGGAPLVIGPDPAPFASIAHRDGALALALSHAPVGVDIEPLEAVEEPAWNVLHADERAALAGLDATARHRAFLAIWTAKEAYLKALRAGLSREPAEIASVHAGDGRFRIVDTARGAGGFGAACEIRLGGRPFLIAVARLDAGGGGETARSLNATG